MKRRSRIFVSLALGLMTLFSYAVGWSRTKSELRNEYWQHSRRAAPRDGFPVLHNPEMVSRSKADEFLRDHQWVIGIEKNGESKAYPVGVMGKHELVNDVIGGHPIAVCW